MAARPEIVQQLRRLLAAFPAAQTRKGTLRVYVEELEDVDAGDLEHAVQQTIREWQWRDLPPISHLRKLAADRAARRREDLRMRRILNPEIPPDETDPAEDGVEGARKILDASPLLDWLRKKRERDQEVERHVQDQRGSLSGTDGEDPRSEQ